MNYCTNCGTRRYAGRFCGECGQPHPAPPPEDEYVDDPDDDDRPVRTSSSGSGGGAFFGVVVLLVAGVLVAAWVNRPQADESSVAFAAGRQVAVAHLEAGGTVTPTTADEVCETRASLEGAPAAAGGAEDVAEEGAAEQETAEQVALDHEAGCRRVFEERLADR